VLESIAVSDCDWRKGFVQFRSSASQSIGVLIILFLKEQRQRTVWLVGKFFFGSLPVCFKASVLVVFSLTLKLS